MAISVYYDGECPFCSRYVRLIRLRELVGDVRLINLREEPGSVARLSGLGMDPDQGMAVEFEGRFYFGDDAINRLALLSTPSGRFNRLNHLVLRHRYLARPLYPLMRTVRNGTLFLLGRPAIRADDLEQRGFVVVFSVMWGLFAFLHYLVYVFQFDQPIYPTTLLTPVLGVALLFKPASRRIFVALLLVMSVDAWLHMPVYSNHTIIKNVVVLAMLLAGVWQWLRAGSWQRFVDDFSAVGRCVLLTMYVFGVFHKINSGFLDPEVSCAVALWQRMPGPLNAINGPVFDYLAIYGALLIESAIFFMLLVRRWRHMGILLGVAFHMTLALSDYAMYAPFSMLSIALHSLFLSPQGATHIVQSSIWRRLVGGLSHWQGAAIFSAWAGLIYVLASFGNYSLQAVVLIIGITPFWWAIAVNGQCPADLQLSTRRLLWSRTHWINLLSILFFLNCVTPYFGLKTAQSGNMFANLRLEGGVSNHLLLTDVPGPFGYLDDLVSIERSVGSPYLGYLQREGLYSTYYGLLDALDRSPAVSVSFERNGRLYENQNARTLAADIEAELHPRWFRNWFHFAPVDLRTPKPCALDR